MRQLLFGAISVICWGLTGCAPKVMPPDVWRNRADRLLERVDAVQPCCEDLAKLPFRPLRAGGADFDVAIRAPLRVFDGVPAPVLSLTLPAGSAGQTMEFFSYSDRKRGMLRLDSLLFLRPSVLMLDASFRPLAEVRDLSMCWGSKNRGGGVWARMPVPPSAAHAVIYFTMHSPTQTIDTRVLGGPGAVGVGPAGAAIIESISEKRQSYIANVRFGLEGLLGVEVVANDSIPLGRCVVEESR